MTVILVKRECPRHPGRWTMGEPCDLCASEDFQRRLSAILDGIARQLRERP